MAGMAIDQREPDVARYIDSYKFEENQAYRRDKFGGGTSLPLNSDGYEDKQQKLRNERHDDWMQQQDKGIEYHPHAKTAVPFGPQHGADYEQEIQRMTDRYHNKYNEVLFDAHTEPQVIRNALHEQPKESVYYRVGTPEQGFPGLGSYENQRKQQNYARQQEYNDLLSKQREMEQKKYEQRRHARAQPPAQPQQPQMDYNLSQEQARAEEKRSYQDYMGKYQHPNNFPQKPPINYEENKRVLNEERKREYNLLMEKKTKEERYWQNRGKPATPPGGLNIGNYDRQLKEQAAQKKKDYKEMLDKQKSEQMRLRAYDHMAETSPAHVKYLQEERPLVGSPRDINYALQERDARDKFGKGLGRRPRSDNVPPQPSNQYSHIDDDPQIKAYLEVEKDKLENKRRYAEELLQQQREHMYLRARQEPEVAVLDRSGPQQQYVPSKPPAGPGYRPKDDPTRQTPRYWNEGKLSRGPPSQDSDAPASRQSSKNGTPLAFRTVPSRRPIPERPHHGQPPYHGEREPDEERKVLDKIEQAPKPKIQEPQHTSPDLPPQVMADRTNFVRHGSPEKRGYDNRPPPEEKGYSNRRSSPRRGYNDNRQPSPQRGYERDYDKNYERRAPPPPERGYDKATQNYDRSPRQDRNYDRRPPQDRDYENRPPRSPQKGQQYNYEKQFDNSQEYNTNRRDREYERGNRQQSPPRQYKRQDRSPERERYDDRQRSPEKRGRERSPERSRPQADQRSRTPPEWLSNNSNSLQKPTEEAAITGTPLAFKTQPYRPSQESDPHRQYSREGPVQDKPYVNGFDRRTPPGPSTQTNQGKADYIQTSPRRQANTHYVDNEDVDTKRKEANAERKKEYNDYLRLKSQERRHDEQARHPGGKPAEVVKNQYYSSEDYERFQRDLQKQQNDEYKDFLSKKFQPALGSVGLPLGQYKYEPKRLLLEKQRNEDYNDVLREHRFDQYQPVSTVGLPLGQYRYEPKRLAMEQERNKEYNDLLKKPLNNSHRSESPQGLNLDVTFGPKKQAWLEQQRNKEYNDLLRKVENERLKHQRSDPDAPSKTTYGSHFKQPPPSPSQSMGYHQSSPSPMAHQRESQGSLPPSRGSRRADMAEMGHRPPPSPARRADLAEMGHRPPPSPARRADIAEMGHRPPPSPARRADMAQMGHRPPPSPARRANMAAMDHRPPPSPARRADIAEMGHRPPPSPARRADIQYQNGYTNEETSSQRHVLENPIYPQYNGFHSDSRENDDLYPKMENYAAEGNPHSFRREMTTGYSKAKSNTFETRSLPATPSKLSLPLGQYDDMRPFIEKQRNREYNMIKDKLPSLKTRGMTPRATNVTLLVGEYDETVRHMTEHQRNQEYNTLLQEGKIGQKTVRVKVPTPPNQQGLPLQQSHYEHTQRAMEIQRNKEYNEFLQKKYGGRTQRSSRSLPERGDQSTSFYTGSDQMHMEKKKMLDDERKNEYRQFVKEHGSKPSKHFDIPTDTESGLAIGQRHHDAWKKFLLEQRNKEYNQLIDGKDHQHKNRDWNYQNEGVLELRGDDAQQSRQKELKKERQKEYNDYISQLKAPPTRNWPEPDLNEGSLIKSGEYEKLKEMYDAELKKDFASAVQRSRENYFSPPPMIEQSPRKEIPVNSNPMVEAMGQYETYRQQLMAERKRELQKYLDRKDEGRHIIVRTAPVLAKDETPLIFNMGEYETDIKLRRKNERKKEFHDFLNSKQHYSPPSTVRENLMPHVASSETPLINHLGQYNTERARLRQQRHQDFHDFVEKHPVHPPYETTHENLMPHAHWAEVPIVTYLGKYDLEKVKFRSERNKESRDFTEKRKQELRNPHDHFVYPTVAVAEKPIVEHMGRDLEQRKSDLRQQRKHDYDNYLQKVAWKNQKMMNPSRRTDFSEPQQGPFNGLFHGLGEHGNNREALNEERRREYNDKLNQQYAGKERPHGRPNWVKEPLPYNQVERSPVRSPLRNPGPQDHYQQMLDEKRREEASRRRYDDPEYQDRLAQGSRDAPRYGY